MSDQLLVFAYEQVSVICGRSPEATLCGHLVMCLASIIRGTANGRYCHAVRLGVEFGYYPIALGWRRICSGRSFGIQFCAADLSMRCASTGPVLALQAGATATLSGHF